VALPPGTTVEVLPSVRVSSADAPGLVIEGSPRRIRVGDRPLRRGERWLLRPGQSATVDGARIVAGWDDPGTASEARGVLRAALRGEMEDDAPEMVAVAGPLAGRRIRLRSGVLGRGADAATRLDEPSVSRVHARLELDGTRVRVADLGSKNGSWLDGERLSGLRELESGEELRAGRTVLALAIAPLRTPAQVTPDERRSTPWPVRAALLAAAAAAATAALLVL
jgi:pSer/pThr/pTyr-binding forkhead associated (FHA) protein